MSVRIAALPLLALALVACTETVQGTRDDGAGGGNGDGNGTPANHNPNQSTVDPTTICSLLDECGQLADSMTECVASYEATRVSADCAEAAAAATCSDLAALEKLCFPSCATTDQTCNDDGTITTCSQGSTFTFTCTGICKNQGTKYSGTCGTESTLGDTSDVPKCWCQ